MVSKVHIGHRQKKQVLEDGNRGGTMNPSSRATCCAAESESIYYFLLKKIAIFFVIFVIVEFFPFFLEFL